MLVAKSVKFQKNAGNLAKYIGHAAKPAENIKVLQNMLKNEKVFAGLSKKGPLSKIFIGGAPRLFGNRQMRMLMRKTKFWLGFLDYIGIGNFVGPEELSKKMSEAEIQRKLAEYGRHLKELEMLSQILEMLNIKELPQQPSPSSSSINMPSSSLNNQTQFKDLCLIYLVDN